MRGRELANPNLIIIPRGSCDSVTGAKPLWGQVAEESSATPQVRMMANPILHSVEFGLFKAFLSINVDLKNTDIEKSV